MILFYLTYNKHEFQATGNYVKKTIAIFGKVIGYSPPTSHKQYLKAVCD